MLVPRASGVLSALGLAISDVRRDYVRPFLAALADVERGDLEQGFADMAAAAAEDLDGPECEREADLRYRGQSFELTVDAGDAEALAERLHEAHERRYGYALQGEPVEVVNLRLTATVRREKPVLREGDPDGDAEAGRRRVNFEGEWTEAPVLERARMGRGSEVEGPAIVELAESTCVVRPGWAGRVDDAGTLALERG